MAFVAASFAACVAACNSLSGVDDLQPCTFCELDGAPSLDAAGAVEAQPRDGGPPLPDARDSSMPTTDAAVGDATLEAEAAAPLGCQGAIACQRVVFVTSVEYTGDLGGVAGADAKCQARADASTVAGIHGRTFLAWVSTLATSPSTRMTHGTMPYVLGDGRAIASNWGDLTDGSLINGIDLDELGLRRADSAWTATNSIGASYTGQSCQDWTSSKPGDKAPSGNVGGNGGGWSASGDDSCDITDALYCFEK